MPKCEESRLLHCIQFGELYAGSAVNDGTPIPGGAASGGRCHECGDRLQYETKSEEGVKLAKNRHTYPLIVYLGLERASDMTPDEVLTTLRETDILDTPEL
jgi:hypothetical protein